MIKTQVNLIESNDTKNWNVSITFQYEYRNLALRMTDKLKWFIDNNFLNKYKFTASLVSNGNSARHCLIPWSWFRIGLCIEYDCCTGNRKRIFNHFHLLRFYFFRLCCTDWLFQNFIVVTIVIFHFYRRQIKWNTELKVCFLNADKTFSIAL